MIKFDFVEIFKTFIQIFWNMLQIPLIIVVSFIVLIVVLIIARIFYFTKIKGMHFKKRQFQSKFVRRGKMKRVFCDFPRRVALDLVNSNPDKFGEHGVIVFTGRQGRGKTSAMAHYLLESQDKYPKVKVITNFGYKYQDKELDHWKRLIDYKNGEFGVIAVIDEMQNWFSSNQSKNFPPEMLSVITQNRKNKRVVLGTAQNFYLLAKALRSQCTEMRECFTIARCLTIVRRREPVLDVSGEVVKFRNLGMYFFVHSDKLRNCYDTYKVIDSLKHAGFKDKPAEIGVSVSVHKE